MVLSGRPVIDFLQLRYGSEEKPLRIEMEDLGESTANSLHNFATTLEKIS
jgi:hypothetical protein